MSPIDWIKNNKLATFLILVVLFLGFSKTTVNRPLIIPQRETFQQGISPIAPMVGYAPEVGRMMVPDRFGESTSTDSPDGRRVVTETYLSLQVNNVLETISNIKAKAESLTGFMVNSSVSKPEEAATGMIVVRVPTDKSDEMISFLKEGSIKVVSENIQGRDITDQYKDIELRLVILERNKARLETIMGEAETVEEILRVQTQLFNLQDQIDSLIGQRDYLRDTSDTVKITAYLSTDEYALPYVPDTSWRPEAVFKEAVRSLIMDIRSLGNSLIWLAVYSVIWIPVILLVVLGIRYWKARNTKVQIKKN